jgi:hypothetical protein
MPGVLLASVVARQSALRKRKHRAGTTAAEAALRTVDGVCARSIKPGYGRLRSGCLSGVPAAAVAGSGLPTRYCSGPRRQRCDAPAERRARSRVGRRNSRLLSPGPTPWRKPGRSTGGLRSAVRRPSRHDQRPLGLTLFLIAAAASFLLSTAIWLTDNKDDEAVFVGLWVRRSSRPAALAWSR